jgi:branched-chain amino acid transport system permease protein
VNQFVSWLIEGIPFGCVYALVAIGIVLTYKTTGVFNFAFAAQAFIAGAVYVEMVEVDQHRLVLFGHEILGARAFGLIVAVLIVSPLVGLLLDRILFRAMRTSGWQVKLVSVLGLFVALPEITKIALTGRQPVPVTARSSIPPMFGINSAGFNLGTHFVAWDFTMAAILTVVVVIVLGLIFRYTATGLQMRAVVESPRMVELAGVDSERVSAVSWMLSSTVAGLAGVILVTLAQTLDSTVLTLVVIFSIAAAVVGRLRSIPITFAAGVLLGFADRALPDVLQSWFGVSSTSELAKDLRPTLPFVVMFLVLVLARSIRQRRESTDPLAGVDPPPPAMAHTYKTPEIERLTKILFPLFIVGFIAAMLALVSGLWVFRITDGLTLAVAFLSITIITGFAGQISLAQATFAGLGGFTAANLALGHGIPIIAPHITSGHPVPVLVGVAIGAIVAAAMGALFALPALRLGGIYLTLATLAFGLMVEQVIFNRPEVSNSAAGLHVPRPEFAHTDRTFFLLTFAIFAVVAFAVILIRKGTTGRFLMAIRGSETAAASIGINATALRITLFALSAGVAGIGGGLIAMSGQDARVGDAPTFPTISGIVWVVLVVTLGSRTVDGAVNAAIGFVVFNWLLGDALRLEPGIVLILFGLGAITYARHPEGIVEYQTRKSILEMARGRALGARAQALARAKQLPDAYTPVARVVLGCAIGPALYFAYLLVRSATQLHAHFTGTAPYLRVQGHWATAHSTTLLCFILPSVVFLLAWMWRTDTALARQHGDRRGKLIMIGGAALGALLGWLLQAGGNLPGSALDCALIGIPVGAAACTVMWLPHQVELVARAKGWLQAPITWKEGRIPAAFTLAAVYLYSRLTTDTPPNGWPVCFVAVVFTIVWLQAVVGIQGAVNELAIGNEGEAQRRAEGLGQPPIDVDTAVAPVAAPVGGAE